MTTGQTFLALGAMALLSTASLSVYRSYNTTYEQIIQSKLGITAVSLASSITEEAMGKAFDKKTDDTTAGSTSALTPVASLGMDVGEYYPDSLNDFDDFNNLNITKVIKDSVFSRGKWIKYGGGTFNIKCKVVYVLPGTPDIAATSQTYNKKLSVQVTCPEMKDTIRSSIIFSYWYF
ncbi:MAG: hypothetical protein HY964_09960 [Ignavibacteriales bacterium]|nr:hypothetical protein [Ignavibacteriales bacterium]